MTTAIATPTVPAEITEVAERFMVDGAREIIGMDAARNAIYYSLQQPNGYFQPTILIGHTGTAKSTLLARIHQDLGWPMRSFNAHDSASVESILGKWIIKRDEGMVYNFGILPFCMKHGISLVIEEINYLAPEVAVLFHELMDRGYITLSELDPEDEDYIVVPHPNFRIFGTMNPSEFYAGARDLGRALASRSFIMQVQVLGRDDEIKLLTEVGAPKNVADSMVTLATEVRDQFDSRMCQFFLSTRDLIQWVEVTNSGIGVLDAAEMTVVGKAQEQRDIDYVRNRVRVAFDPNGRQEF